MDTQSPLRRSNVGVFKTPARPVINDDEQEREATRRSFMDTSTVSSSADQCDSLQLGLKLFQENKFTKDNAWNIQLIDSFTDLIRKHHIAVGNLQMAGYGLEASTKLWGLRVDSTHEQTMRLLSGLGSKKASRLDGIAADDTVAEEENPRGQKPQGARRKRRPKSTIARNVESINAPLETVPLPDPIAASLRSVLGSIANPKNLLCNRLSDRNGVFNLDSNAPYNYTSSDSESFLHAK